MRHFKQVKSVIEQLRVSAQNQMTPPNTQHQQQYYENEFYVHPSPNQSQFYATPPPIQADQQQSSENQYYGHPNPNSNQFFATPLSTQTYQQQFSQDQFYVNPTANEQYYDTSPQIQHTHETYGTEFYEQPAPNQEFYATQPIIQQYPHRIAENENYVRSLPVQSLPHSTNREQAPAPQNQQESLEVQQEEVPLASITPTLRTTPTFRGVRQVSQKGVHKVIVYEIPGGSRSYTFMFKRKSSQPNVATYICAQCKKANTYTAVTVSGDDFMQDPTMLAHACIPVEKTKDKADRLCTR
ncbi:unnamed protein product [Cylicostephanus goldi]|uniref:Uncharacterized protein n=1 Tax=Cylicostephanus goldi TaxID=71465 RepID=A0A3P6RKG5_CYLGO|nr:unnamed protein product [Cylicostephanus goldi]